MFDSELHKISRCCLWFGRKTFPQKFGNFQFEKVFLNWIPFIMLMRRPNVKFINFQAHVKDLFPVGESFIENCEGDVSVFHCLSRALSNKLSVVRRQVSFTSNPSTVPILFRSCLSSQDHSSRRCTGNNLNERKVWFSFEYFFSIPAEHLSLERKVGEGILHKTSSSKKKINPVKQRRSLQFEKYVRRCIEEAEAKSNFNLINGNREFPPETSAYCEYTLTVVDYYTHIHNKMKYIRSRLQHQRNVITRQVRSILCKSTCKNGGIA